jgi:hypothetical protein
MTLSSNWPPNRQRFERAGKGILLGLAKKIEAPADADGEWFHKAIYELQRHGLPPKQLFSTL